MYRTSSKMNGYIAECERGEADR